MTTHNKNYLLISFGVGFIVWLAATVLFRIGGQYFFLVDNVPVMVFLYLMLIPALGFIATWTFNVCRIGNPESAKAAAVMVLPGMLLDVLCIQFFEEVFPNLPVIYSKTFGAWLMFAYAIVLIAGLVRKKQDNQ